MCLAIPGKVLSIKGDDPLVRSGRIDFDGVEKDVNLAYLPEAKIGDYVLVHVGFGISIVDQGEAERIFETLRQLGELQELEDGEESASAASE